MYAEVCSRAERPAGAQKAEGHREEGDTLLLKRWRKGQGGPQGEKAFTGSLKYDVCGNVFVAEAQWGFLTALGPRLWILGSSPLRYMGTAKISSGARVCSSKWCASPPCSLVSVLPLSSHMFHIPLKRDGVSWWPGSNN